MAGGGGGGGLPAAAAAGTVTDMAEQLSIAEMLARGMYGSDGIGAARQQGVGVSGGVSGGGGGGSSGVLNDSRTSSSSLQAPAQRVGLKGGMSAGAAGAGGRDGDARLGGRSVAEVEAEATATAVRTTPEEGATGVGAVDEDGGGGKGTSLLDMAPVHGSTRGEVRLGMIVSLPCLLACRVRVSVCQSVRVIARERKTGFRQSLSLSLRSVLASHGHPYPCFVGDFLRGGFALLVACFSWMKWAVL